jgi:hypothetical protein
METCPRGVTNRGADAASKIDQKVVTRGFELKPIEDLTVHLVQHGVATEGTEGRAVVPVVHVEIGAPLPVIRPCPLVIRDETLVLGVWGQILN